MHTAPRSPKKLLFLSAWPLFFAITALGKKLYGLGLSYRFQMDWGSLPNPEWFDHEYEFETVAELEKFLGGYFKHVYVWERRHADRLNFYFRCSDSAMDLRARSVA